MAIRYRHDLVTLTTLLLVSCTTPAMRYHEAARELGLERHEVESLILFAPREHRAGVRLHVYIEGDGLPHRALRSIPPDPTPLQPVALRLMARDPAPSVLLGRPCQHGARPCDTDEWTLGRYGESVVSAMTLSLRAYARRHDYQEIVLIGFSGGGTLAMLIAERIPETVSVVTLAGNLDVRAWTHHHDYAPLRSSLDPARRPALPTHIFQLHLLASQDRVTPPRLMQSAIDRQTGAIGRSYADFDHSCCWVSVWPEILRELEQRLSGAAISRKTRPTSHAECTRRMAQDEVLGPLLDHERPKAAK